MRVSKRQMRAWIRELERVDCTFWACEGSHKGKIKDMITCIKSQVVHEMREAVKNG